MTQDKTILIAHRQAAIRDRFAAALADARHAFVTADTDLSAREAASATPPVSLALVDLGLAEDGVAFVRALRHAADRPLPVVIFAGTVGSVDQVRQLADLRVAGYVNEHAATPHILPSLAPHLFPDNFDRRTSPRIALGIPVSYQTDQTRAGALTLDIGRGGLAIRTMSPLAPETPVTVQFRLPSRAADLEAAGRVAWSNRQTGMGIRFERLTADDQAALDEFIDAHARNS